MNLTRQIGNPKTAALAGLALALPLALMAAIATLQIEPFHDFLKQWSTEDGVRQTTAGLIAILAAFLLLLLASLVTLFPAVRAFRAGHSLSANRVNLLLGVAMLVVFAAILGGVFVDQLPCLAGEPNCD